MMSQLSLIGATTGRGVKRDRDVDALECGEITEHPCEEPPVKKSSITTPKDLPWPLSALVTVDSLESLFQQALQIDEKTPGFARSLVLLIAYGELILPPVVRRQWYIAPPGFEGTGQTPGHPLTTLNVSGVTSITVEKYNSLATLAESGCVYRAKVAGQFLHLPRLIYADGVLLSPANVRKLGAAGRIDPLPFMESGCELLRALTYQGKIDAVRKISTSLCEIATIVGPELAMKLDEILRADGKSAALEEVANNLPTNQGSLRNLLYALSGSILATLDLRARFAEAARVRSGTANKNQLRAFLSRLSLPGVCTGEQLRAFVTSDQLPLPSVALRDLAPGCTILTMKRELTGDQLVTQWNSLDERICLLPEGTSQLHSLTTAKSGKFKLSAGRTLDSLALGTIPSDLLIAVRGARVEQENVPESVVYAPKATLDEVGEFDA